MAHFEARTYPVKEGAMDEWSALVESTTVSFIEEKGMKVGALFHGAKDPNAYVWIRRFDSDTHRQEMYNAVYETDHRQTKIKPTVRRLMDVENTLVHLSKATDESPLK